VLPSVAGFVVGLAIAGGLLAYVLTSTPLLRSCSGWWSSCLPGCTRPSPQRDPWLGPTSHASGTTGRSTVGRVSSKLRTRLGFAVFAVLAILGLFVLGGVTAGVVLFAAMLVFIGSCISALRGEDPDSVAHNNRTGFAGWFGNWF
jgi:hypothetical protein